MKRFLFGIFAASLMAGPSVAGEECTLVVALSSGDVVHETGAGCDARVPPASTFKIALAVMGYDAGFLESPGAPEIAYDPAIDAPFETWKQTTTPERWLKHSVVWYSREITRALGAEKFAEMTQDFEYGNGDVSGRDGKDDGLTHAWLGASLEISPREQADFLRRLWERDLPVGRQPIDQTLATMQRFETSDGSLVIGKTGMAVVFDDQGEPTPGRIGWFVGAVLKSGEPFVFVRLLREEAPDQNQDFISTRAKESILAEMDGLLSK